MIVNKIKDFILSHHSKVSQLKYEQLSYQNIILYSEVTQPTNLNYVNSVIFGKRKE